MSLLMRFGAQNEPWPPVASSRLCDLACSTGRNNQWSFQMTILTKTARQGIRELTERGLWLTSNKLLARCRTDARQMLRLVVLRRFCHFNQTFAETIEAAGHRCIF